MLYRLGHLVIRYRYLVAGAWLVFAIALTVFASSIGEKTSNNLTLPGTESTEATDLLDDYLPKQANGTNPVALKAPSGKLTDSANSKVVRETVSSLERSDEVRSAVSPLSTAGKDALSDDETIGYISVTLTDSPSSLTLDEANEVIDATAPATDAGFEVGVGGYLGEEVSKPSTRSSEAVGLAAAVIILLFAFGTVVAMGLPITTAILGLASGLALVGILGHLIEVPVGRRDARDDDRARRRDRLLALHHLPPPHADARGHERRGVDRALACRPRAAPSPSPAARSSSPSAPSALAGIPIVTALGISAAVVVFIAVLAAADPAPGAARDPRRADQLAAGPLRARRVPRPRADPLAALVALGRGAPLARDGDPASRSSPSSPRRSSTCASARRTTARCRSRTTLRRSYDLLSEGFGAGHQWPVPGRASSFAKPAHNDQKSLDQLKQQQQAAEQQEQQAVEQGEEEGLTPAARPSSRRPRASRAPQQQKKQQQQEEFLKSTASDPRPREAPEPDQADAGRRVGHAGQGGQDGQRRRVHGRSRGRRPRARRPRTSSRRCATTRSPRRPRDRPDRLRRRDDGRLHRPRRPDRARSCPR